MEAGNRFKVERDGEVSSLRFWSAGLEEGAEEQGADVDLAELNGTDFEYYVNYDGMDSRCDEWVVLDRIDTRIPFPLLKIKSRGRGRARTSSCRREFVGRGSYQKSGGALMSNNKDDEADNAGARSGVRDRAVSVQDVVRRNYP